MDEYVSLTDLTKILGCHENTTRNRLRRIGAEMFIDSGDNRRRLVERADAERLLQPRPVTLSRRRKGDIAMTTG